MKILHAVEFYQPSLGGAQEVIRQISERLVQLGHDVTVATTDMAARDSLVINGVKIAPFKVSGNYSTGMTGELEKYRHFLKSERFDVILFYAAQQWTFDAAIDVIDDIPSPMLLAPCGFSGLRNPVHQTYFQMLPNVLSKMQKLIFHSKTYQDYVFCQDAGLSNLQWIPNGASEVEFANPVQGFRAKYHIDDETPLLLTVGSHTGIKGHRTAIEALARAKIGKSCLAIIGNRPAQARGCTLDCKARAWLARLGSLGRKRILLLDPPREDVLGAYFTADIFVFGSNVECSPLVLFESMAAGLPFISTACGNAAEIAQWGQSGIILPTTTLPNGSVAASADDMARQIEVLFRNTERRKEMADLGRSNWRNQFTWDVISRAYESSYRLCTNT